jgi:hypothetical protein
MGEMARSAREGHYQPSAMAARSASTLVFAQRFANDVEHSLGISECVIIPEPEHPPTLALQELGTFSIVLLAFSVLAPVDFNN